MGETSARPSNDGRARVAIALGHRLPQTISDAIDGFEASGLANIEAAANVAVVAATSAANAPVTRAARFVVDYFHEHGFASKLVVPRVGLQGVVRSITRRGEWRSVDVSERGARFARIAVRADLYGSALVGVGAIGGASDQSPIAIGLWQHFVHPGLALPARLRGAPSPLLADLASAFRPSMLILVGNLRGYVVAAASDDLITAELAGLALRYSTVDPELRHRPWEDSVVQRATELDLGVRLPSQIHLSVISADGPADAEARQLAVQIREMLGLPTGLT